MSCSLKKRNFTLSSNARDTDPVLLAADSNLWVFNLNMDHKKVKQLTLERFVIYNLTYNITSSNQTVDFDYNAVNYSVAIPPGQYTIAELCSTLEGLMQTAIGSTNITVTYDNITFKVTFTSVLALALDLNFDVSGNPSALLGFDEIPYLTGPTHTGDKINSGTPLALYVQCPQFVQKHDFYYAPNKVFTCAYELIMTADKGGLVVYERNYPGSLGADLDMKNNEFHFFYDLGRLEIKFFDENRQVVDLNSIHWQCTFTYYEV